MNNQFIVSEWMMEEVRRMAERATAFATRMPPMIRVRRRGFPADIKRGDDVKRADGVYRVVRRSNWHLWLERNTYADGQPLVGDTIRVRLPKRYAGVQA